MASIAEKAVIIKKTPYDYKVEQLSDVGKIITNAYYYKCPTCNKSSFVYIKQHWSSLTKEQKKADLHFMFRITQLLKSDISCGRCEKKSVLLNKKNETITEKDIQLVMTMADVDREYAITSLCNSSNMVDAVLEAQDK